VSYQGTERREADGKIADLNSQTLTRGAVMGKRYPSGRLFERGRLGFGREKDFSMKGGNAVVRKRVLLHYGSPSVERGVEACRGWGKVQ